MSGNKVFGFIPEDRLTGRGILRTLFMPEIRLSFGSMGMTHRAFISVIATMFIQSGLLPYNHPAQNMNTVGQHGIRSLMGEAWYNLRHQGKGDVQQWGMFVSLFLLFGLAVLSVLVAIGKFTISSANAGTTAPGGLFSPFDEENDMGLRIIENLIGRASKGEGSAIESALGDLLMTYSYGVLVIASFIVAWSILSIVVDTAATGRFFGGRHNPVWWPIRLVFALGILVPIGSHGFNAGQLMVIEIAKWGSNFASNAWGVYATAVIADGSTKLLAKQYPTSQAASHFKDIMKIYICQETNNAILAASGATGVEAAEELVSAKTTQEYNKTIIRYGNLKMADKCGAITFNKPNIRVERFFDDSNDVDWDFGALAQTMFASNATQENIYNAFLTSYNSQIIPFSRQIGSAYVASRDPADPDFDIPFQYGSNGAAAGQLFARYQTYFTNVNTQLTAAVDMQNAQFNGVVTELKKFGWPVASLWYYILSSANSEIGDSANGAPAVTAPSYVIDTSLGWWTRAWNDAEEEDAIKRDNNEKYLAAFEAWWEEQVVTPVKSNSETASSNMDAYSSFKRTISGDSVTNSADKIDGRGYISKIFDKASVPTLLSLYKNNIRDKGFEDSRTIHPIVLMAEIGRDMIFLATGIVLGIWVGGYTLAFIAGFFPTLNISGPIAEAVSSIANATLLTVSPLIIGGVVLSIILPMTPFIRFVFAISSWMIAILEAVVMVPIIAIGHLRTDGEGLIGPSLQSAYTMLLQLLLRPILVLLGLVMSMALVEVTVGYVNETYFVMLDSIPIGSGWNPMNMLIRYVGFSVMYGVLMYGLINSSFKIIDLFPESVVKFLGSGASGGLQDREDGNFNSAIVGSAIFASRAGEVLKSDATKKAGFEKGQAARAKRDAAKGGTTPPTPGATP